ncbi:hypothetical protein HDE_02088 [Halotydeus destructor]|nr:hypothetical protein HDE_02088 [Halotydeus destructor]
MVRIVTQYFEQLTSDNDDPYACQPIGPLGLTTPLIPKILGFNCTAFTDLNDYEDGNYTGLIGHLIDNTADYVPIPLKMPLRGNPVAYGPVTMAGQISFATLYKRPRRALSDSDLMVSFMQIDVSSWISLLSLFLGLCLLLKLKGYKTSFFTVAQCFLQSLGPKGQSIAIRILGWTMLQGFFVLTLYYSNFILTRIVSPEQPVVLRNFADMLDPNVDLSFSDDFPVFHIMKESTNPTMQAVVAKAEKLGLENITMKGGMTGYNAYLGPPKKRLFGIVGGYNDMKYAKVLTCTVIKNAGEAAQDTNVKQSIWIPNDSPQQYLMSQTFNKRMDKKVKSIIDFAVLHFVQQGLYGDIYFRRIIETVRDTFFQDHARPERLCYSDEILVGQPDNNHGIDIKNTDSLFLSMAFVNLFALVLLLTEIFVYSQKTKSKGITKQRMFAGNLAISQRVDRSSVLYFKGSPGNIHATRVKIHRVQMFKEPDSSLRPWVTSYWSGLTGQSASRSTNRFNFY